jgi:hypothetical protein
VTWNVLPQPGWLSTQIYKITFDYQTPYRVCGGLQCGSSSTTQTLELVRREPVAAHGLGGCCSQIEPEDPNIIYSVSQDGTLWRHDLRTSGP